MISDFKKVLDFCADNIHFATLNVSSPNTKDLRKLQQDEKLRELLSSVNALDNTSTTQVPIFLKISPDLDYKQLEGIVALTHHYKLAGIIASNTSIDYKILGSKTSFSQGGVSGTPLFRKSTQILAQLSIISEA